MNCARARRRTDQIVNIREKFMKYFFLIIGCLATCAVSAAVVLKDADAKPLTRNGQQEAAMAVSKIYRQAASDRALKSDLTEFPTAVCAHDSFNFGMMDPLTVGQHTFVIQNKSSVNLIIEGGESTCKCTLSDLKRAVVLPGEEYPVTLTWNSGHARQEFRQSATILTNDPTNREISLSVFGKVRAVLAATPTQINLGRLIPSTESSELFTVYSQVWEDFEIARLESTSDFIKADLAPPGSEQLVSTDDELSNAKSQRLIQLTYNGEAPRGPLSGQIRIHLRPPIGWGEQKNEVESTAADKYSTQNLPEIRFPRQEDGTILAEIPFYGVAVRRLSLYGRTIQSEGSIALGTLSPKDSVGNQWTIIGRIRGNMQPTSIAAVTTGIPGLKADIEIINANPSKYSFRIVLSTTRKLNPAIYNGEQSGMLRIEADGMPAGDDLLEFPINLIVVKNR